MRKCLLLVLVLLVPLVAAAVASAQTGTPNVPSATTWQGDTLWQAEVRFYKGGNDTLALGAVTPLGERTDLTIWYTHLDGDSQSPIAGAMRESRWSGLSFALKQELRDEAAAVKVALIPSLEWCLQRPRGVNADTGASAEMKRMVPGLAVPVEWAWDKGSLVLCPRLIFFDKNIPVSTGGTIRGFGTMFTIGAGGRYPVGRGAIVGDVARPFSGNNTVNEDTGVADRQTVWSVGYETAVGDSTMLTAYFGNAAGPSQATSVLGTPGNGIGCGLKLGHTF